ncbi:hypothetical protein J2Z21_008586 [Streptomyces griseochromogenes]|uniref:Lipoprotein n=1 Tax=Streptomyces griseochromogenes TaxID=68214 RepID=A0ABS4M7B6_9ACTN|nr:hypothetical protein [Streptomyces griseochromogenes]MBP2055570.1 hypothetical protein [Streptomyces griseochromogenes]
MRSQTASALCAAAVALLAGACGGAPKALPHVTAAEVVGHWTSDCGSTLTVEADRTFTVQDFPVDFAPGSGTVKRLPSGHGTWYLFAAVKGSTPQTFDLKIGEEFYDLDYVRKADSIALRTVLGDPDDNQWCEFSRRSRA